MKNCLLIFVLFILFVSCNNISKPNVNMTTENGSVTNTSNDKFIGKWVKSFANSKNQAILEIRKEGDLYIIDKYGIGQYGIQDQSIITGKLENGSIIISSAMTGNIDFAEQSNKLYLDGREYKKEQ